VMFWGWSTIYLLKLQIWNDMSRFVSCTFIKYTSTMFQIFCNKKFLSKVMFWRLSMSKMSIICCWLIPSSLVTVPVHGNLFCIPALPFVLPLSYVMQRQS
jgi:hypothetical protein